MGYISDDPRWLAAKLDFSSLPADIGEAVHIGTADQVCPHCGRAEKFGPYCSLCFRPTQLADVRIHPPADTHGCVFKRVPLDAKNGGWGDGAVGPWDPAEGVRGTQTEAVGSAEGA